jgi:HAD superfamily hydrolase (TIGR01509 family)
MAASTLLFDVDGTLWASYRWYAEVLAGLSGTDALTLLAQLTGGQSIVGLLKQEGVSDARFRSASRASIGSLSLYGGVIETLSELKRRGTPCGVVTNLPGRIVTPLLDAAGLDRFFQVVVHAGTVRPGKPHPGPLLAALSQMGISDSAGVVYVGDAATDAEAADRAGVEFAWASYGYGADRPPTTAVVLRAFGEVLQL